MMPSAPSVSGMYNVDATAANAGGKPVQRTTSTKISQTWLASHTGPMECSISAAGGRPAPAVAGEQVPEAGAEVGPREEGVRRQPDEHRGQHRLGRAHRAAVPSAVAASASCGARFSSW